MGDIASRLPKRSDVEGVYVVLDIEVICNHPGNDRRDWTTANDFIRTITNVTGESVHDYVNCEPIESEYASELKVYPGKWAGMLTLDQWLQVADNHLLDLDDDEVLPDNVEPTLGIMTVDGTMPAVSIPGIEEGYGYGGYEPSIIANMYVAVLLNKRGTRNQYFDGCIDAICNGS